MQGNTSIGNKHVGWPVRFSDLLTLIIGDMMFLPPCDMETRSAQRLLVKQMKKYILEHAKNDGDVEKMISLLFDVLSSLDGFYNEFPNVSIVTVEDGKIINGYLHKMLAWR